MKRRMLITAAAICTWALVIGLAIEESGQERNVALNHEIVILNDGVADDPLLAMLTAFLSQRFGLSVRIEKNFVDFSSAHRSERGQWDYTVMLQTLHPRVVGIGRCVLLTNKDTFGASRNNWSTGIAATPGLVAIVSVCRLNPVFWGRRNDKDLYYQRVRKIVLHELGHTFGRSGHCDNAGCVLHQSDSIAAIDKSGNDYCAKCDALARTAVAAIRAKS